MGSSRFRGSVETDEVDMPRVGSIIILLLMWGAPFLLAPCAFSSDLLLLDPQGGADTLTSWRAITVAEFDIEREPESAALRRRLTSAPVPVGALVHGGLVIPLEDVAYLIPSYGIYVTKDGHRILGRPLHLSALDRQHRHIDVDRQRMYLVDEEASPLRTSPRPRYLFLDVRAEHLERRQVAGHVTEEILQRSLQAAGAVVFDPAYAGEAERELQALAPWQAIHAPEAGEARVLEEPVTLYRIPEGRQAARVEAGTRLLVGESDSHWCRVILEGWLPLREWIRAGPEGPASPPETEEKEKEESSGE